MTQHPLSLNVYMEICHHRLQREKCLLQTLIKDQDLPTSLFLSDNTLLSTFFSKKMNDLAKVLLFFSRSISFLPLGKYRCLFSLTCVIMSCLVE